MIARHNKSIGRARILPKRSSPRWGEQAVMREQDSAKPLKHKIIKELR